MTTRCSNQYFKRASCLSFSRLEVDLKLCYLTIVILILTTSSIQVAWPWSLHLAVSASTATRSKGRIRYKSWKLASIWLKPFQRTPPSCISTRWSMRKVLTCHSPMSKYSNCSRTRNKARACTLNSSLKLSTRSCGSRENQGISTLSIAISRRKQTPLKTLSRQTISSMSTPGRVIILERTTKAPSERA